MSFSDGVCVQSIEHPGCVWDAKFLENGDIATACSDGVARIWTVNQDKIADALEVELYLSQIAQHKISRYFHLLVLCMWRNSYESAMPNNMCLTQFSSQCSMIILTIISYNIKSSFFKGYLIVICCLLVISFLSL